MPAQSSFTCNDEGVSIRVTLLLSAGVMGALIRSQVIRRSLSLLSSRDGGKSYMLSAKGSWVVQVRNFCGSLGKEISTTPGSAKTSVGAFASSGRYCGTSSCGSSGKEPLVRGGGFGI